MKNSIKYIVIDVDGTMTDGGIYYDENGNEIKKFCTKDAAGFFVAHAVGIKTIVITGRKCAATSKRMKELHVDVFEQNVKDKVKYLNEFIVKHNIKKNQICYIGDDLNDYFAMKLAGYIGCPADSCSEIIGIADYVSTVRGGYGAVRDIIEHFMRETGQWDEAIKNVYDAGI